MLVWATVPILSMVTTADDGETVFVPTVVFRIE
jgi:hypothetical protein